MDRHGRSMAQKRARHYDETKTLIATALILFGCCSAFVLIVLWPQQFLVEIFNSRLTKRLVIDDEDLFTCSKDFRNFVIDEPEDEYSMITFYVFSVTNAQEVLQRGYKPSVEETGPYGFVKYSYKYDIYFDPDDSTTVSFKEYSYLREVEDPNSCEEMFYRMERDFLEENPCANDACKCRNTSDNLVIVNPLFLKVLWEDSPFELLGHFSAEVFDQVKTLMDEPFTEAVKAHIVSYALKEVYQFRTQMQAGLAMKTAMNYFIDSKKYTFDQLMTQSITEKTCNLSQYSIGDCPFNPYSYHPEIKQTNFSAITYPSIAPLFNSSNSISFLDFDTGFPGWLGIVWYLNYIDFNSNIGYAMVTRAQMKELYEYYILRLGQLSFNVETLNNKQRKGCEEVIQAMGDYLVDLWLYPLSVLKQTLQKMAYREYQKTHAPVACEPLGRKCVWQFGYMTTYEGSTYVLNDLLTYALIDLSSEVSTNPNNMYKDVHAPGWYNVFLYRQKVFYAEEGFDISCTNYGYTIKDATLNKPAALWAAYRDISTVNTTALYLLYNKVSDADKEVYFYLAMNISYLMEVVYRSATDFHDHFVVNYINKNKDPAFTHDFTVGNWTELGLAQWGSGVITEAIAKVRTTKQIVRDGMWRFGEDKYYTYYLEYSSWCVLQGYPYAWLYSIEDAKILLYELARQDAGGVLFREHIMYIGSTLIGDGINKDNDVGDLGDVTFTREANRGNFSCIGESFAACSILNRFINSSKEQCQAVGDLYTTCFNQYTYSNNKWIDQTKCGEFETSITSPSLGIQCGLTSVYGHNHPYLKSIGNIVYQMLYSLTLTTALQEGLWCDSADNCDFTWGGMFTRTTVDQLLFTGFTEPSILKYMNLKYAGYNISFDCVYNAYDKCGVKNYRCDNDYGVMMKLPNNQSFLFHYNETQRDLYLSPSFYVKQSGEMLFPYAQDELVSQYAKDQMSEAGKNLILIKQIEETLATSSSEDISQQIVEVRNPYWMLFPAWTYNDTDFMKHYQCEKRTLNGLPYYFNSCEQTLFTGRDSINNTLDLKYFYGNDSIYPLNIANKSYEVNGSTFNNQYPMYLWSGFSSYPYTYSGRNKGANYFAYKNPSIFNKILNMQYTLSQDSLLYTFQREISVTMPLPTTPSFKSATSGEDKTDDAGSGGGSGSTTTDVLSSGLGSGAAMVVSFPTRRFVEDVNTWNHYRHLGISRDSYGMPYMVPKGFASLERFASFPLFVETPHSYGNKKWGGEEYTFVSGTSDNENTQRTFVDYDPVTGRALRSALRQQISVRIEASAIFPNAFSSQQRCIVPTKSYALSTGYGCFAYAPIIWYEEARIIDKKTFFQYYDHFYTRPARGNVLTITGLVLGSLFLLLGTCLCVSEEYHRRRFKARVYVD